MKKISDKKKLNQKLRKFLMSSKGFISIEEARKEANKRWLNKNLNKKY